MNENFSNTVREQILNNNSNTKEEVLSYKKCQECNGNVINQGGCDVCLDCGLSKCS